ncbi:RIB43A-like with coiled-coils protein 2 [Phlebotomus argentipes]|uniref:RIB43A-like with coiled-coils protein 2 n=1 Tax=Phlebotomus argentipes TaxID=94469 RepID=UPI0028929EB4|nr:RIB43A-like with coiled-coils protein 2 [Phlebotomus argentipes]
MDRLKVATEKDLREAAAIERRREREEERKKRIFDAKARTIGVDVSALDGQLEEKRQLQAQQDETRRRFVAESSRCAEVAQQLEEEAKCQQKQISESLNDYRRRFQRREDTREWDLNDPWAKRKAPPARISDSDPRLSVSGGQRFLGEDLTGGQRAKLQQQQQREWLQHQMAERRRREEDQRKADVALQRAIEARDRVALDLERSERSNRRKCLEQDAQINRRLARQRQEEELRRRQQEVQDNLAEMCNFATSDMLTENPEAANSSFGPGRKIPYMYRGMSPEEIRLCRENQLQQIAEKQERERGERLWEDQWDGLERKFARMSTIDERAVQRRVRANMASVQGENQGLAKEQKTQLDHLNGVVYRNSPTNEYFEQFNTTTR